MGFRPVWIATQAPGCFYYRGAVWSQHMKGEYYPIQSLYILPNWEEVLAQSSDLLYEMEEMIKKSSVVVWQRLSTFRGLATLKGMKYKYNKKKMFVDIDDDVFNVDSVNPGFATIAPGSEACQVFKAQLKDSDGVIVSTEVLAKAYKQYNKNIHVIPNSLDFKMWDKVNRKKKRNDKIKILWQGGHQHLADLEILMPVVPKILKKHDVEFHFMGMCPDFFKMDRCFSHKPVIISDYPKAIRAINPDIILAPLVDTHMNRARSNLRVLEAGAMSVPVVAQGNPKLPYHDIITKSSGGLLSNTMEEWVENISFLIENEKTSKNVGRILGEYVRANFNVEKIAKEYKKVLGG